MGILAIDLDGAQGASLAAGLGEAGHTVEITRAMPPRIDAGVVVVAGRAPSTRASFGTGYAWRAPATAS